MRIYDPLNGLAFLLEAPRVIAAVVYAFCIHPHNVSLRAIARQNSLKQMNRSFFFFFEMQTKEETLALAPRSFGDKAKGKHATKKPAYLITNQTA